MERERAYPDAELVLGEDGRDLREVGVARQERRHLVAHLHISTAH